MGSPHRGHPGVLPLRCSGQAAGVCLLRLRRCPVTPASFPSQGSRSLFSSTSALRLRRLRAAQARGERCPRGTRDVTRLRARLFASGHGGPGLGRSGVPPAPRPLGWAVRRRIRRGIGPWPRAGPAEPAARCVCGRGPPWPAGPEGLRRGRRVRAWREEGRELSGRGAGSAEGTGWECWASDAHLGVRWAREPPSPGIAGGVPCLTPHSSPLLAFPDLLSPPSVRGSWGRGPP